MPMHMGRTPWARGSKVPACPTLVFLGSDCFMRRTASMDVIPIGLLRLMYPLIFWCVVMLDECLGGFLGFVRRFYIVEYVEQIHGCV